MPNDAMNGAAAPKVARRGIGNARGTQRLKFTEKDAKPNGLFLGMLENVDVSMIKIGEETQGLPSFNGLEIPRIRFTFTSADEDVNKRKYVTLSFTAVESNVETIPGGKGGWKVDAPLSWLKHILNTYVFKGRELTEDEENLYSLPFIDYDETGAYVPVAVEEVIAGWKVLFEAVANTLNTGNNDTPYYKVNGKSSLIWMKLLRYTKAGKKGWTPVSNGDLAFPVFIGEGCIELYKPNTMPAIHLDVVKECIKPMNIEKPKPQAPNMMGAGMPGMPAMGGVPMNEFANSPIDTGFGGVATDMPFGDMPEF